MSQENVQGYPTWDAGEDLEAHRLVKAGAGKSVTYADATDFPDGRTERHAKTGGHVGIRMVNTPGTMKLTTAGAIDENADFYAAADGKIAATGSVWLGKTLEAASGNNSVIETVFLANRSPSVHTHTVTAGEAAADTATLDTGFGTVPTGVIAQVRSSAGAVNAAGLTVTLGTGGSAGQVTVAATDLAEDDVITVIAFK